MKVEIGTLRRLFEVLSAREGLPLDYFGLTTMSVSIGGGLGERYLYELYRKVEAAEAAGQATLEVSVSRLETVSRHLGHGSFRQFVEAEMRPLDRVLAALVGQYYSYVRGNRTEAVVIQSPVRIRPQGRDLVFELCGPMRTYEGQVELAHGCLFILMREPGGKRFQHVYKIGTMERPTVLQGIFSGVSTVFEPIGGRAVLVRCEESWSHMVGREWPASSWKKHMVTGGQALAAYFDRYEDNNLSIHKVATFTFQDLAEGKGGRGAASSKKRRT